MERKEVVVRSGALALMILEMLLRFRKYDKSQKSLEIEV